MMIDVKTLEYMANQSNVKCKKPIIVPDGFRELLQDMTVEVLRTQPQDPLTFCIEFLLNRKKGVDKSDDDTSIETETAEKKKFGMNIGKGGASDTKGGMSIKGLGKKTASTVESSRLFSNVDKSLIANLEAKAETKSVETGEKMSFEEDQLSDKIYFVQSGTFEIFVELPFGKTKVAELTTGGYFGDLAETIACIAKTAGKLIAVNRSDINETILESINKRREEYKDFIEDMELFEKLSTFEKRIVIDSMVVKSYGAGQEIIKEQDDANDIYLLYEGFVSVLQEGKEINTINEGGYFGELALLDKQPRAATVKTISDATVLVIDAELFRQIIEPKCVEYMDKVIKTYFGDKNDDDEDEDDESVLDTPPAEKVFCPRKSVSAGKFNPEMDDDDDEDDEMEDDNNDYTKTDEQRNRLRDCCKDILLFRCLDGEQLEVVINAMFQKVVVPGDVVITKGEDGDNFYVIDNGLYDILVPINGVDTVVAQYDNKGSFGELALMYNTPRSATVRAKTNGLLWAMSRDQFRKIVLKKAFQKRLMYDNLLGQVPFLKELSSYERMNVADALRTRVYEAGDPIIKQGEEGLEMYFIEEGIASIYIDFNDGTPSEEVGQLDVGKYFGEMALINRKPRAATILAKTKCKIAVLDRESFERLLGPCVNVMKRNMQDYGAAAGRKSSTAPPSDSED